MSYIVTLSPQGQITIPVAIRKRLKAGKYILDINEKIIILRPARIFAPALTGTVKKPGKIGKIKEANYNLSIEQEKILFLLREGPKTIGELLERAGFKIEIVLGAISYLEIYKTIAKDNKGWRIVDGRCYPPTLST